MGSLLGGRFIAALLGALIATSLIGAVPSAASAAPPANDNYENMQDLGAGSPTCMAEFETSGGLDYYISVNAHSEAEREAFTLHLRYGNDAPPSFRILSRRRSCH